jgi:hypothetical protein
VYTYTYGQVGNRQATDINGEMITYTYDVGAPERPPIA